MKNNFIYVCSKYSANTWVGINYNTDMAKEYCKHVVSKGLIPIAPHLLYPQFLNDDIKEEREMGLKACIDLLNISKELWVFEDWTSFDKDLDIPLDVISQGMATEINFAQSNNIKIRKFKIDKNLVIEEITDGK